MNKKRNVEKWRQGNMLYTRRQLRAKGYKTRLVEPAGVLRCDRDGQNPIFFERHWAERGQVFA